MSCDGDGWCCMPHYEFFGGEGIHAATAWHRQSIIFGPRFTRTRGELADPALPRGGHPRTWRSTPGCGLGIQAAGQRDEFAAIGLGEHRWTNDWLKE